MNDQSLLYENLNYFCMRCIYNETQNNVTISECIVKIIVRKYAYNF